MGTDCKSALSTQDYLYIRAIGLFCISERSGLIDFGTYHQIVRGEDRLYIKNSEAYFNWVYADNHRPKKSRLGNTETGDGWNFRGRGILQLTGRENYQLFSDWYSQNVTSNLRIIDNPTLLKNDINIAVLSALWFFNSKVMGKIDIDSNTTVYSLTYYINTKREKLAEREAFFAKLKIFINCIN